MNTEALRKRYPQMNWDSFLSPPPENYEIKTSKNGDPSLLINNTAIHSLYNPKQEALKQLKEFSDDYDGFILLGFGLGYLIPLLLEKFPRKPLYLAESNGSLWRIAFEQQDFSAIIANPLVHFLLGAEQKDELATFWMQQGHMSLYCLMNRPLHDFQPAFYDFIYDTAHNFVLRRNVNVSTLKQYGQLWMRNLSRNLPLLADIPGVYHLFGCCSGIPALLIGAGPSLNRYLPLLQEMSQKAFMVVVDTACPVLLAHGIQPDVVVSVDSQYWNSRHLDGCSSKQALFVTESSLYPAALHPVDAFKRFFYASNFPVGQYFEQQIESKGRLKSGGSVATTAFDLCRQMGASSIWALGIDLGFPQAQTHVKGSRFEQWALADHTRLKPLDNTTIKMSHTTKPYYYPANRGGMIMTDRRMEVYRRWFEEEASSISCFNLSDGIAINHMKAAQPEDFMNLPTCRPQIDRQLSPLLAFKQDQQQLREKLTAVKEQFTTELHNLGQQCHQAHKLTKELLSSYNKKNVQALIKKLDHLDASILDSQHKESLGFLLEPFFLRFLKNSKESANQLDAVEKSAALYRELADQCHYYQTLFQ